MYLEVAVGPGDDAAVLHCTPVLQTVATTEVLAICRSLRVSPQHMRKVIAFLRNSPDSRVSVPILLPNPGPTLL
jgi:hypothetical protein